MKKTWERSQETLLEEKKNKEREAGEHGKMRWNELLKKYRNYTSPITSIEFMKRIKQQNPSESSSVKISRLKIPFRKACEEFTEIDYKINKRSSTELEQTLKQILLHESSFSCDSESVDIGNSKSIVTQM